MYNRKDYLEGALIVKDQKEKKTSELGSEEICSLVQALVISKEEWFLSIKNHFIIWTPNAAVAPYKKKRKKPPYVSCQLLLVKPKQTNKQKTPKKQWQQSNKKEINKKPPSLPFEMESLCPRVWL